MASIGNLAKLNSNAYSDRIGLKRRSIELLISYRSVYKHFNLNKFKL